MTLNVIELVTLSLHQSCHVQENLMKLKKLSLSPLEIKFSIVSSSAFCPVMVKYLRSTVSLYSAVILFLKFWKSSIISFNFFPNPPTTEVLVRSAEEPGPQPATFLLATLDLSKASSFAFTTLTFLRTCSTSMSIRERSSFMVLALWTILLSSLASCNFLYSFSTPFISSLTLSTSSKNLSRFTVSLPASMSSK